MSVCSRKWNPSSSAAPEAVNPTLTTTPLQDTAIIPTVITPLEEEQAAAQEHWHLRELRYQECTTDTATMKNLRGS